jgi:hypothetical protein
MMATVGASASANRYMSKNNELLDVPALKSPDFIGALF